MKRFEKHDVRQLTGKPIDWSLTKAPLGHPH